MPNLCAGRKPHEPPDNPYLWMWVRVAPENPRVTCGVPYFLVGRKRLEANKTKQGQDSHASRQRGVRRKKMRQIRGKTHILVRGQEKANEMSEKSKNTYGEYGSLYVPVSTCQ